MDILNRLVMSLDGELPTMNEYENREYENHIDEYRENYKDFIQFCDTDIPSEKKKIIIECFESCNEAVITRNSILNDLYYKDGIRDGGNLILEIIC